MNKNIQILEREQLKQLYPYLHIEDKKEQFGFLKMQQPILMQFVNVLAKLAKIGGAKYIENCHIEEIYTENETIKLNME